MGVVEKLVRTNLGNAEIVAETVCLGSLLQPPSAPKGGRRPS